MCGTCRSISSQLRGCLKSHHRCSLVTQVAATGAKPAYAGRTVPDKSAKFSRAVAESPRFFLVRDGGLCACSRGFNRPKLFRHPLKTTYKY